MKLKNELLLGTLGLASATAIRAWLSTLSYKVAFYDPSVDPAGDSFSGQKIFVFWHEYILIPIHMRGHCNLAMLVSQHSDAEILTRAAYHLGFACVRGSTRRGGVNALRELMDKSRSMNLTITPDGPRGPRRKLAPGAVFLASKLQMPLVMLGLGCDRAWRMKSWDRFCVPKPWSRVRAVVSPAIHVPEDLSREELEHYRLRSEQLLNHLTCEAEAWAESGTKKFMQQTARRGGALHRVHRQLADFQPRTVELPVDREFRDAA